MTTTPILPWPLVVLTEVKIRHKMTMAGWHTRNTRKLRLVHWERKVVHILLQKEYKLNLKPKNQNVNQKWCRDCANFTHALVVKESSEMPWFDFGCFPRSLRLSAIFGFIYSGSGSGGVNKPSSSSFKAHQWKGEYRQIIFFVPCHQNLYLYQNERFNLNSSTWADGDTEYILSLFS